MQEQVISFRNSYHVIKDVVERRKSMFNKVLTMIFPDIPIHINEYYLDIVVS